MAGTHEPRDERLGRLIDAALHRYFSRLIRRYVPVLAGLAVLAVVAVALPSRERDATSNLATGSGTGASGLDVGSGDGAAATGPGDVTGGTGPVAVAGDAGSGVATGGTGAASAGPQGSAGGSAAVSKGSASGVSRSGVKCGQGALQVTWTPYAPPCVAAFSGSNGGATAPGVTDKTVTITLRDTADSQAFHAPFKDLAATLQVYIDFFNKNYEFYGRQLVLKTYSGKGSFSQEVQGGGQSGAQTDAETERAMGSFANLGSGFSVFGAALADKKIMFMGNGFSSEAVLQQYSPFMYGSPAEGSADDFGHAAASTICQRMKGLPAAFAGQADYQQSTRKFGLVAIQQPDMKPAGDVFEQDARSQCGLTVKRADYNFDVPSEPQQAAQIVVQMKNAGVTTLVSAADPLMFAQMTLAAERADWHPEYVTLEPLGVERSGDTNQTVHAIKLSALGPLPGNDPSSEAGRVYRLASGGAAPRIGGFDFLETYMHILQFANGVQAAGPNLTPASFLAGKGSLADAAGEFGLWKRSQRYNEVGDFVVSRFDPAATAADGEVGVWKVCNGGARYLNKRAAMGSGQLGC